MVVAKALIGGCGQGQDILLVWQIQFGHLVDPLDEFFPLTCYILQHVPIPQQHQPDQPY